MTLPLPAALVERHYLIAVAPSKPNEKKDHDQQATARRTHQAVEEGGDDDDEITEDEAIAILRDTGLDAEDHIDDPAKHIGRLDALGGASFTGTFNLASDAHAPATFGYRWSLVR
jgi:hypothetical protein